MQNSNKAAIRILFKYVQLLKRFRKNMLYSNTISCKQKGNFKSSVLLFFYFIFSFGFKTRIETKYGNITVVEYITFEEHKVILNVKKKTDIGRASERTSIKIKNKKGKKNKVKNLGRTKQWKFVTGPPNLRIFELKKIKKKEKVEKRMFLWRYSKIRQTIPFRSIV